MALGLNKILVSSTVTNTPSAYWQLVTVTATTAGNVIPAGTYLAFPAANISITAVNATNATTGNATSVATVLAANTGGVILSDGANVFANATTNGTLTLATVNGGLNAPGTFNT